MNFDDQMKPVHTEHRDFTQFIGGRRVDVAANQTFSVINPATEDVVTNIPFGDQESCLESIEAAEKGFRVWREVNPFDRAIILKKAAALMLERLDEYAKITVLESGKPLAEAIGEWKVAANFFEWYAEEGKRNYGRAIPASRNNKRMTVIQQPLGVVGAITAWNFPAYNPARCWAAALGAGCSVVAKPSELTPLTAMLIAGCLHDAGIPNGVMNLITGDPSIIGQLLLQSTAVRKISFTGSTRVGKILMDGASITHTRLSLELGGNAPVLIFPDVDVERIAVESVVAKLRNAGQVCIAPQRYILHEEIAERFLKAAKNKMEQIISGNGLDPKTEMGPLIREVQRENIDQMVKKSIAAGAEVQHGGNKGPGAKGFFFEPTLLRINEFNNPCFQYEIFGPVMPVITFKNFEEGLALANQTPYGLASYVFTNDLKTSIHASEKLEFGMVGINEWYPQAYEAPFGGWKQSGLGYECGPEGMAEYTEKKLISIGGI